MTDWHEWVDAPADRKFAVLGDPIAHSRSPQMHNSAFRALNGPWRYTALRVAAGEVADALDRLDSLGYLGVNVTIPLKEEAVSACRHVEISAQRIGAVNTIKLERRIGTNTDALGFARSLPELQPDNSALVLGAGGSARAVAVGLLDCGAKVSLWARRNDAARAVIEALEADEIDLVGEPDPAGYDYVVNCTSASLRGERLPIAWERAQPGCLAVDLYYGESEFLESARRAGLDAMDGLSMLVEQGALSIEFWLGIDPPRDVMREALR